MRALQDAAMRAWAGIDANVPAAQKAFYGGVKMNLRALGSGAQSWNAMNKVANSFGQIKKKDLVALGRAQGPRFRGMQRTAVIPL